MKLKKKIRIRLPRKFQTKLLISYGAVVVLVLAIICGMCVYILQRQLKNELVRADKNALLQVSNNIVLTTELMIEKMIALYSSDDIQWFFSKTKSLDNEAYQEYITSDYENFLRIQNIKKLLIENTMLYTNISGSAFLITEGSSILYPWIRNKSGLNDYETIFLDKKDEWDDYFEQNPLKSFKWEIFYDCDALSFQKRENEDTLSVLYCYRSTVDRSPIGYISVNIDAQELKECLISYMNDDINNMMYILFDNESIIPAVEESEFVFADSVIIEFIEKMLLGETAFFSEDEDNIYTAVPIFDRNWILINRIPNEYFVSETAEFLKIVLIIFLLGVIGACVLVYIFTFKFSSRFNYLKIIMKQAQEKNYTITYKSYLHDEFDEVGENLNQMIQDMNGYISRIIEERKEKKMNEINYLHAQINTHFLYNIFNSIKILSQLERNEDINIVITSLVKLLRGTLDVSREMLTIREELQNVEHYFTIQKVIYLEDIELKIICSPTLMGKMIPKLLIQPVAENSFLHGFNKVTHKKCVEIRIEELQGSMYIKIQDNGCGMELSDLVHIQEQYKEKKSRNIGLANVKERIQVLFGLKYGLKIESEIGIGTTVTLHIPSLETEFQAQYKSDIDSELTKNL